MGSWSAPALGRVIGTSHQRQGLPCQDAVLSLEARDVEGASLQLMAVADGHGGSRYHLSDIGSRLACEQVAAVIREQLSARALSDPGWEAWLQQELPGLVQSRWLRAIAADWQLRDQSGTEPFSALSYGTTLGMVLMTGRWWAAGGLGDWDLLAVPDGGPASLLNQEPELGGGSEATASLCLDQAVRLWQQRCQLVRFEPDQAPLALLLSSDGLRKSCATDDDYRILGAYLCGLAGAASGRQGGREDASEEGAAADPADLESALARITSEGSGDDVSVAIGRWNTDPIDTTWGSKADRDPGLTLTTETPSRRWGWLRSLILLGLPVLAGSLIALALDQRRPFSEPTDPASATAATDPASDPAVQARLRDQITTLCRTDPVSRRAILLSRRVQVEGLQRGLLDRQTLLRQSRRDPLAALIAWSQPQSEDPPADTAPAGNTRDDGSLELCPGLDRDLRELWRTVGPTPPSGIGQGRPPAAQPRQP